MQKFHSFFLKPAKLTAMEILLLAAILLLIIMPVMLTRPEHPDEYNWFSTSDYFEDWIGFKTDAHSWQMHYLTLSEPNVPRYLIGITRLVAGIPPEALNHPYNWEISYEENVAEGRAPTHEQILIARIPMAILTMVLGGWMYIISCNLINRLFAGIWLLLFISNSMLIRSLVPAMSEAPMLLFSIIACYFIYLALQQLSKDFDIAENQPLPRFPKSFLWILLSGIFISLSMSSKIHTLGIFGIFCLLLVFIVFTRLKQLPLGKKFTLMVRAFSIGFFAILLTYTLLHPIAYPNPVRALTLMFRYRLHEMSYQAGLWNDFGDMTLIQRWAHLFGRLFNRYASIPSVILNILLALIGAISLMVEFTYSLRKKRPFSFILVTLLLLSILFAAAFMSPLDWERYYIYPVFIMILVYAKGITVVIELIVAQVRQRTQKMSNSESVNQAKTRTDK
jgi:hypothetical protein